MHLSDLAVSLAHRIKHLENDVLKYDSVEDCDMIDRRKLQTVILNLLEETYGPTKD